MTSSFLPSPDCFDITAVGDEAPTITGNSPSVVVLIVFFTPSN